MLLSHPDLEVVARARGVSMIFGGTVALNNVDFNVYHGKVNALMGENGAGKSTLMGILAGVHEPTAGTVLLDGAEVALHSPRDAGEHGIRLIHQELLLFPNLSVAENIFAGAELSSLLGVRLREEEDSASALLRRLGQDFDPRTLLQDLPVGQQQIVAICKAISQHVRILIMDEPTSALSTREVESLFRIIRELVQSGVSIVYVSHRIEEVMSIADFVTVLRDGRLVAEAPIPQVDANWVVEQMIGRDPDALFVREERAHGEPALEARGLTLPRPAGGFVVDHVELSVAAGEIVGLYGLMGAGRTELLQCLIGDQTDATGEIRVVGARVDHLPIRARIRRGLFLVPEDRQREGLVSALSVKQNVSLASLENLSVLGSLQLGRESSEVGGIAKDVGVKSRSIEDSVTSLSGGNQQKAVVAKALMTAPKVLLMDDPMRGVDVGAKAEIYRIMKRLAAQGLAIVFTSSDLVEVLGMADRILVMAGGRITGEFEHADATSAALLASANPHAVAGTAA